MPVVLKGVHASRVKESVHASRVKESVHASRVKELACQHVCRTLCSPKRIFWNGEYGQSSCYHHLVSFNTDLD
jgi:hypothetical protein